MTRDPFPYDRAEHEASVLAWRRGRLARLTAPDGWLSLVGRFPLEQGESRVGVGPDCAITLAVDKAPSLIGTFQREGAAVTFTPAAGVVMSLRRRTGVQKVTSGVGVRVRSDRDGAPDKLELGVLTLEITEHETGVFVRVRDPESATRRNFAGIEHYPIERKWRVVAKLEPYEPHKAIDLGYEAGTTQRYASPGAAAFEIEGVPCRIDPVFDADRSRLYIVFRDLTASDSTYGAGRFLYAPLPTGDRVLLDFNLAFSPPCAFTPYSACPIAPLQNRLLIRVEAGEKRPH